MAFRDVHSVCTLFMMDEQEVENQMRATAGQEWRVSNLKTGDRIFCSPRNSTVNPESKAACQKLRRLQGAAIRLSIYMKPISL